MMVLLLPQDYHIMVIFVLVPSRILLPDTLHRRDITLKGGLDGIVMGFQLKWERKKSLEFLDA